MNTKYFTLLAIVSIIMVQSSCKKVTEVTTIPTVEEVKEEATAKVVKMSKVEEETEEEQDSILLGFQKRGVLEMDPYDFWFAEAYEEHTLDTLTINTIKEELATTDITVVMGTWCEDSQREIPALFKILDLAGIQPSDITMIAVSEEKDTPEKIEEKFKVTNVPSIILSKDGKEVGRIVEYPLESLEKDIAKILSDEEYKHAYEE